MYLSAHPLSDVIGENGRPGTIQIVELPERSPGEKLKVVGMVSGVRRITTKTNRTMAIVEFEDLTGTIELVAFPDCYERFADLWQIDAILEVVAKLERRGEQLQLVCETASAEVAPVAPAVPRRVVHLRLPSSRDVWSDIRLMQNLDAVLRRHEGDDDVVLHIPRRGSEVALRSRTRRVDWTAELAGELRTVLGDGRFAVEQPRLAS